MASSDYSQAASQISATIDAYTAQIGSENRMKKADEYNRKMYALQRGHAIEDWNRQNQYSSPENQRKLLKEAGLSPHTGLGDFTAANLQQTQAPKTVGREGYKPPSMLKNLAAHATMQQQSVQTDNIRAQTKLLDEQSGMAVLDKEIKILQAQQDGIDIQQTQEMFPHQVEYQKAQTEQKMQGTKNMRVQHRVMEKSIENIDAQIENMASQGRLRDAEILMKDELRSWYAKGINPNAPQIDKFFGRVVNKFKGSEEKEKLRDSLRAENKRLKKEYLESKMGKDYKTVPKYKKRKFY